MPWTWRSFLSPISLYLNHEPCSQLEIERMYVGPFMTALDMAGFSITLMRVDDSLVKALDAPTQARER